VITASIAPSTSPITPLPMPVPPSARDALVSASPHHLLTGATAITRAMTSASAISLHDPGDPDNRHGSPPHPNTRATRSPMITAARVGEDPAQRLSTTNTPAAGTGPVLCERRPVYRHRGVRSLLPGYHAPRAVRVTACKSGDVTVRRDQ